VSRRNASSPRVDNFVGLVTNATGQTIGAITVIGADAPPLSFQFQVLNGNPGIDRVVGHGKGTLSFPKGKPVDNGPAVPFTITLRSAGTK